MSEWCSLLCVIRIGTSINGRKPFGSPACFFFANKLSLLLYFRLFQWRMYQLSNTYRSTERVETCSQRINLARCFVQFIFRSTHALDALHSSGWSRATYRTTREVWLATACQPLRLIATVTTFRRNGTYRLRRTRYGDVTGAITSITRMVQLPATAAIEYVAACWVSRARGIFVRGCFCPGGLLSGGSFARGDFCPGGLFPSPPSSMRIRTV